MGAENLVVLRSPLTGQVFSKSASKDWRKGGAIWLTGKYGWTVNRKGSDFRMSAGQSPECTRPNPTEASAERDDYRPAVRDVAYFAYSCPLTNSTAIYPAEWAYGLRRNAHS